MAQIVDPRSVAPSRRGLAQAIGLADPGEVPFCGINACPLAAFRLKERAAAGMGNNMVTELLVSLQLRDHAPGDRNDAALPVLGVPDGQGGVHSVDIPVIEPEGFADPEAGHRDQAEHYAQKGREQDN